MLFLADVHDYILKPGILAHDHPFVYLDAGAYEQGAPFLGVVKAVGDALAVLPGNERAPAAAVEVALIRLVALQYAVIMPVPLVWVKSSER